MTEPTLAEAERWCRSVAADPDEGPAVTNPLTVLLAEYDRRGAEIERLHRESLAEVPGVTGGVANEAMLVELAAVREQLETAVAQVAAVRGWCDLADKGRGELHASTIRSALDAAAAGYRVPGPSGLLVCSCTPTMRQRGDRCEGCIADDGPPPSTPAAMLAEFHEAFGQHPGHGDVTDSALRRTLHEEEHAELIEAFDAADLTAIAHELADVVYVAYGSAYSLGIPLDAVIAEVHRANMSKLDEDGKPLLRADGKFLKSDRFVPADVAAVLTSPVTEPAPTLSDSKSEARRPHDAANPAAVADDGSSRLRAIRMIAAELRNCFTALDGNEPESRRYAVAALNALSDHPGLLAALAARSARLTGSAQPPAEPSDQHVYLSTACLHLDHGYCQSGDGYDADGDPFRKRPGQCKWCASPCTCPCHSQSELANPAVEGETSATIRAALIVAASQENPGWSLGRRLRERHRIVMDALGKSTQAGPCTPGCATCTAARS